MLKQIESIIKEAETMKNAYFFNPPCSAGSRRSYEKQHSHPLVSWEDGGHTYTAEFTVTCSCKNIYVYPSYTKDGKKTTLTAIKNSYNRMKNA